MPLGAVVATWPSAAFLLVHLVVFVLASFFAFRAFGAGNDALGWGFTLVALAQLCYVAYDLDVVVVLFAHGLAELIEIAGLGFLFAGARPTLAAPKRPEV
jgi:hypothetical protein